MEFDVNQQKAIDLCTDLSKRLVAITGEAGTGKTTIIKEVYYRLLDYIEQNPEKFVCKELLNKENFIFDPENYIVLAAPTGKAAKRIYEATGIPAKTLHRLLEYPSPGEIDEKTGKPKETTLPKRCKDYRLREKIILCDEYAMVNYELHRNLIDALPNGGVVRMFGDCNQLEPIEELATLRNQASQFQQMLLKFPSIVLDKIHRQAEGSNIIENAHKINKGVMPIKTEDFNLTFTSDKNMPTTIIMDMIEKDPAYFSTEKQIISPSHKTWIGTQKLNAMIQMKRFGDTLFDGFPIDRHQWDNQEFNLFIGDKVIFTKNNYDLGVFNGESGIVTDIKLYGDVTIDFGDKIVNIPTSQSLNIYGKVIDYNPQKDISLAYVITTHKAQGSEYKEVTYVLDKSVIYLCSRKNLYTAITRAREKVNIITDQRTFVFSLKNKINPYSLKGGK